jgi:hypothetical protein
VGTKYTTKYSNFGTYGNFGILFQKDLLTTRHIQKMDENITSI